MVLEDPHGWVALEAAELLDAAATATEAAGDPELAARHRDRAMRLRSGCPS